MSEVFVGEIRMFAGSFAPRGYAFCDGQLLAVSQNDALFSLLGTIYGGDGRTTFGLPDLRGRVPIHQGTGPGLSPRRLGDKSGTESETLTVNQIPSHTHPLQASTSSAAELSPAGHVTGSNSTIFVYGEAAVAKGAGNMRSTTISSAGGSQPHTNLMPTLCIYFIIALFGVYPSRS